MFLSIIIPVYNDEKYLCECLDSCLNQDIPADDYEIICVDDGSTDSTPKILREYESKYSNLTIIFKKHGSAYGFGRDIGYSKASGDYIWFVDHDDLIEENILAFLRKTLNETDCDRLIFPCYIFREYLSAEELEAKKKRALKPDPYTYRGTIWSSVLKHSFLLEHDIWPHSKLLKDKMIWGADGFFINECQMAMPKEHALTDRPYYYYRTSSTQQTANRSYDVNMQRIRGTIDPTLVLKELYDSEVQQNGTAREVTANVLMTWANLISLYLAPMDRQSFVDGRNMAREAGAFPMPIAPEYGYSCKACIRDYRNKGVGPLRAIAFYYSSYEWGLKLYRATLWKVHLSRSMKKNPVLNKVLEFRRKLLKKE